MPDRLLRPRSGVGAKALLLTVLGEFVLSHDAVVWTSTVVQGLGQLGIEEHNARQAVARLAGQGLIRSQKEGRRVRWRLTDTGHHLLSSGTERIYRFGDKDISWDGRWLVILASVPEQQRAKRHQLRTQLRFSGFGFLSPGVALSPHLGRERDANAILSELDLFPGALVLRAEPGELVSEGELLERAWDLDELAARYEEFLRAFEGRRPQDGQASFGAVVELVHAWRGFPFCDPELPRQLLPRRWPADRAKALFDERHAAWSEPANAWYQEIERGTPA